MNPPVVGKCGTHDPKQPGVHTAGVTHEIETTHNFEKDLRCQILGLLVISHLAIDVVVDQAKVFLVKCLKIPCIHSFHSLILLLLNQRNKNGVPQFLLAHVSSNQSKRRWWKSAMAPA